MKSRWKEIDDSSAWRSSSSVPPSRRIRRSQNDPGALPLIRMSPQCDENSSRARAIKFRRAPRRSAHLRFLQKDRGYPTDGTRARGYSGCMTEKYLFADVDLPFHVWVKEGGRWVLRDAGSPQGAGASFRAEPGTSSPARQDSPGP